VRNTRTLSRLSGVAASLIACGAILAVFAGSAAAIAPVELTFKEPEKGSTFAYVDSAPKTTFGKYGEPKAISAGDQFAGTNPVFESGKRLGTLQFSCTATKNSKTLGSAGFLCSGVYKLKGGTLVASVLLRNAKTIEGAITGGTGIYANATGTFVGTEHRGY
jgi:hypothetical protein